VRTGTRTGTRAYAALAVVLLLSCCGATVASAASLPDGRAYELVSRYEEEGREVGLNNVDVELGAPSLNGEAFQWTGIGGCCGASSAAAVVYQSDRGPNGWQTRAMTPAPTRPLLGFVEEQSPVWHSSDLSKTIYETPVSYNPGDRRPAGSRIDDLYLVGPVGPPIWLSQGPTGTGTGLDNATFDGATPTASSVVFSSEEPLTSNATGPAQQFLYVRNVAAETTSLVNVNNSGEVINSYGASLGNGSALDSDAQAADADGTTTNAISEDGSKIFFETPPEGHGDENDYAPTHLYMRDLSDETTTALDEPSSTGSAQYEGAAADGSLVFFTSNEGLDNAPATNQLYEFNTTSQEIGSDPPMTAIPISSGEFIGVSAIANDGSHVFFVASTVLANNSNPLGAAAQSGQPNLYDYDTQTGHTTFVVTLPLGDVEECEEETCRPDGLVAEPDYQRLVYPTPNGEVLLFLSLGDPTGQNESAETTLTAPTPEEVNNENRTIDVASTAGFKPEHFIEIGSGKSEQLDEVETVDNSTQLTLAYTQASLRLKHHETGEAVSQPVLQVYRYSAAENSLTCISCLGPGKIAAGSATAGFGGGGTYAPNDPFGPSPNMSENGARVFFESPYPLVPGVPADEGPREPRNIYEWEDGKVSLIANGAGADIGLEGTTPTGNDVFFATRAQMTPAEANGRLMLYDARVGGGFPTPPVPVPCNSADCRPAPSPVEFSIPASATLKGALSALANPPAPAPGKPSLTVSAITLAQQATLARTGHITLRVRATAAGRIQAVALAKLHGRTQRVASASATLARPGTATLTLTLSKQAMRLLASSGSLALRFQVSYSADDAVTVAKLALHSAKHAGGAGR
jgi:hypothetical protein